MNRHSMPPELLDKLERFQQQHLLRFQADLTGDERESFIRQLETIDFELIVDLPSHRDDAGESPSAKALRAQPPAQLVRQPASADDGLKWQAAKQQGEELLAAGKVGAILVAGGQGTRLGFPHPKGMFAIGPVSGNTLFQMLAEQLLARSLRAGVAIPYYVMTSDATHDETVRFFEQNNFFGLNPDDVAFFRQGNMPAVDAETGELLLAEKGKLSTSPDGHGGMLRALAEAGLIDDMQNRRVEYLYYHQVDNPTAVVCDPAFLGWHVQTNSEMSTKVAAKRSAAEKMGVAVDVDGITQIIEYSDLPDEVAQKTDETGDLLLWAGSMAIHLFNREFLERLTRSETSLPFHLANKHVPFLDETGNRVTPAKPNAVKFERFIFDAMPFATTALIVEADRAAEFNPVKNAEGHDSPTTSQAAMSALFRDWLQSAGAHVPADVPIEISPLFALDVEEVQAKVSSETEFDREVWLNP